LYNVECILLVFFVADELLVVGRSTITISYIVDIIRYNLRNC
jgi:hypothetical protein